jgi:hypothetical protein
MIMMVTTVVITKCLRKLENRINSHIATCKVKPQNETLFGSTGCRVTLVCTAATKARVFQTHCDITRYEINYFGKVRLGCLTFKQ